MSTILRARRTVQILHGPAPGANETARRLALADDPVVPPHDSPQRR